MRLKTFDDDVDDDDAVDNDDDDDDYDDGNTAHFVLARDKVSSGFNSCIRRRWPVSAPCTITMVLGTLILV